MPNPGDGMPTLAEVRTYLDVPEAVLAEVDLVRMWATAQADQRNGIRDLFDEDGITPLPDEAWPASLVQALLRRVQRAVATRNLPLGYASPEGEFGGTRLLNFDALIEEYEGPYRKVVVS